MASARCRCGTRAILARYTGMDDPYDLARFVEAQRTTYEAALAEVQGGRKISHWMWFVFPQIAGLGHSAMAQRYAIGSLAEARAFLAHPVLGARLREITGAAVAAPGSAEAIFGTVDAAKLRSSMTLFAVAAEDAAPFVAALDRFFGGARDAETIARLR